MILRILVLIYAILVSPSMGKINWEKFQTFDNLCFQNEVRKDFRVIGQDQPLSNTLENFIAMAEKIEVANPTVDLKGELAYFISEYVFEDIKFINGRIDEWNIGRANFDNIDDFWDTSESRKPYGLFSNADKCSLYHMISHSTLERNIELQASKFHSFSSNHGPNPDDYFPQELGVVAIRGSEAAVSLSKVLIGLFVGLKSNRKIDLNEYERVRNLNILPEQLPRNTTVDGLYAVTMADVLMRAAWSGNERPGLAKNGKWKSIPINDEKKIDGFCPMLYLQQIEDGRLPAYSYSSVRGAADGLILGLAARYIYMKKPNTKLSQILRMYYSPAGIRLDSPVEDIENSHISFCNRQSLMQALEPKLLNQMKLYGYLIAYNSKDAEAGYIKAQKLYFKENQEIFQNSNAEILNYCDSPISYKDDTNRDILIIMDSRNSKNSFQEQQMIIGYLAKYLDLRYTGSRASVLLDYMNIRKTELKTVEIFNEYSSSAAACYVGQTNYKRTYISREDVVIELDQFIKKRKGTETKFGKVVVYFNFEKEFGENDNKTQGRLEKALQDMHTHHQDVTFFAVGLDLEVLKKYVENDPSLVILATDGTYEEVANKIFRKISSVPTLLKYTGCSEDEGKKIVSYENLISPYTVQYYKMPSYFYKSLNVSFKFESQNGNIRVCYSRATTKPEWDMRNCKDTENSFAEIRIAEPCKGFSENKCPPIYFSVLALGNDTPRHYCKDLKDKWCATLDQIKFKVSHTGVRCR